VNLYGMVGNDSVGSWDYLGLTLIIEGDQKYRDEIEKLLKKICPKINVDDEGVVHMVDEVGDEKTKNGCCCLMKIIGNEFENKINMSGVAQQKTLCIHLPSMVIRRGRAE